MSGASLPRLLPRARDGYKALHPWKAAFGRGRSFATAQDGPSTKKYGINAAEVIGSSRESGPGQSRAISTYPSSQASETPASTPSASGPPPPPPPSKSSAAGRLLGFSLLGAAAGGGGYVWYTWDEGGPWGLWGPDVFVFPPIPGLGGGVVVEKKDLSKPDVVVVELEVPRKEEVAVAVGGGAMEGVKDGEGKKEESTAEVTEAAIVVEEASASDVGEDEESSADEDDDGFDAMEAARKASLASERLSPRPQKETGTKPADTLLQSGKEEESSEERLREGSEPEPVAAEAGSPSEELLTKPLDLLESAPAPLHQDLADLEKEDTVSPRVVAKVVHEARMAQAAEDAAKYKIKLEHEREYYQRQLKEAHHETLRHAQMLAKREKELEEQKRKWEAALEAQHERDDKRRQHDLAMQKEAADAALEEAKLAILAIAECKIADERAARLVELEDIKIKLKALSEAFNARSEDAKKSYITHKLAVGAFALEDAIRQGSALSSSTTQLHESLMKDGEVDPLVDAALASLPPDTLKSGTNTHTQLQKQLADLEETALELALIPAEGSGVLAYALAKLVAKLKVSEKGTELEGGGADAVLVRAEELLADGKLVEAAKILNEGFWGTKAEEVVGGWSKAAQERAVAEQALALIQAHAAAQSASLR